MNVTDSIPIESVAKISLDGVLKNIQFRNKHGFKLLNHQFTQGNKTLVLEFTAAEKPARKPKGKATP